jgi:hypothetical protein
MFTTKMFPIALVTAAIGFAGAFSLEFGNPAANPDPRAKDAAVIVRAVGCHQPEKAQFTGTAEGIVNGKRQTIPLTIIPLSKEGVFAVNKQWPNQGTWVLTFASTIDGHYLAGATVPVSEKGVERAAAVNYHGKPTDANITEALTKTLAQK